MKVGRIEQLTHTPAPWDWFTNPRTAEKVGGHQPAMKFLVGSDGQGFAHTVGLSEPQDTANARLIAAAPELLAALKDIVSVSHSPGCICATHEAARAAIAKAEWNQP